MLGRGVPLELPVSEEGIIFFVARLWRVTSTTTTIMSAPLTKFQKECRDRRALIIAFMAITIPLLVAGLLLLFLKEDWNVRSGVGVALLLLLGTAGVAGNIVLLAKQSPPSVSGTMVSAAQPQDPGPTTTASLAAPVGSAQETDPMLQ